MSEASLIKTCYNFSVFTFAFFFFPSKKMSNKHSSCSTSADQARLKKIRINGLSKDYKFLKWVEANLQRSPPGLEYFSFAEQFEGTEEATNTN